MTPISSCVKNKIEDRWLRMIRTTIKSKPLGLVHLKEAIALPHQWKSGKATVFSPKSKEIRLMVHLKSKHSYQLNTFSTHR